MQHQRRWDGEHDRDVRQDASISASGTDTKEALSMLSAPHRHRESSPADAGRPGPAERWGSTLSDWVSQAISHVAPAGTLTFSPGLARTRWGMHVSLVPELPQGRQCPRKLSLPPGKLLLPARVLFQPSGILSLPRQPHAYCCQGSCHCHQGSWARQRVMGSSSTGLKTPFFACDSRNGCERPSHMQRIYYHWRCFACTPNGALS